MNATNHIRYIRRPDIDIRKWDACIDNAPNGLIYAKSFWLDAMTAGQWDALVFEDYTAVMPLCYKRRWSITYLYQPPFTQQGGIFTALTVQAAASAASFLSLLPRHYRFAEIFLNHANAQPGLHQFTNLILDLTPAYPTLAAAYKTDLVRNLRSSARTNLIYHTDIPFNIGLELYQHLYQDRTPHVTAGHYTRFASLCQSLDAQGQLITRAVTDTQGNLLATAVLPKDKRRLYLVQSAIQPQARGTGANHFLLDNIIREFAGQDVLLDFEGSELPGVAHFYRNFGAIDQPYYYYRYNHLPWPIRLLKPSPVAADFPRSPGQPAS